MGEREGERKRVRGRRRRKIIKFNGKLYIMNGLIKILIFLQ